MKRLRSTMFSGALAALGVIPLGATPSLAVDTKVMAGGQCFTSSSSSSFRNGAGIVANTSGTSSMLVLCYPVRDTPTLKPTKVEVAVVDNSSAATGVKDISCFMRVANRFGTGAASGATVSTIGVHPAGTVLDIPIPAANIVDGSFVIVCTIPRHGVGDSNSWLASVKWTEPDQP